jgi:hypothetical protein
VHLRRALLLFAIVLGMAALVASISRPIEERRGADTTPRQPRAPGPPPASPRPAPALRPALSFDASEPSTKRLPAGDAATIKVSVPESGSVLIPDMGLVAPATPDTPATFPVRATRPGRYELLFTPSADDRPEPAGRLVVTSDG